MLFIYLFYYSFFEGGYLFSDTGNYYLYPVDQKGQRKNKEREREKGNDQNLFYSLVTKIIEPIKGPKNLITVRY